MEQKSNQDNGLEPAGSQGGRYRSLTRRLMALAITGAMVACPAQVLADELTSAQQTQETAAAKHDRECCGSHRHDHDGYFFDR